MARLLKTRLPLATEPEVRSEIFNKLIRVLELNLGSYDTNSTPAFIVSNRTGDSWENISTPETAGVSGTGTIGTLQIITAGSIDVTIL